MNLDDFGIDIRTNDIAIQKYINSEITGVSMMVTEEGFEDAVSLARIYSGLDVGLHLNLLAWGASYNITFLNYISGHLSMRMVERMIEEQIEKFKATGLPLKRIDSHCGVHFFPKIFEAVVAACKFYDIEYIRNPVRKLNFDLRDWKQCIGDNIQWLFYQKNKKHNTCSYDNMVEPKGSIEIVCHA